jgi:hypothetical protein
VQAKYRHISVKRNEAAIIIQRNLAPQARALNLARLAMVTIRAYQHIADEVVSFIESFLLEGGINSAVDVFTEQISNKFAVVHPRAEARIIEELIDEAVLVEMHIWLEEQMLAILAENARISEERKRYEAQHGKEHPDLLSSDITWNNLPMEFYNMDFCSNDTPLGAQTPQLQINLANIYSQANSRLTSPDVGQQASGDASVPSPASSAPTPGGNLVLPAMHHRNNFLRSSIGIAGGGPPHGRPMRSSITASFNISPQHYRSVMNRLSSVDMNHSVKYQAALLAANLAAGGSFNFMSAKDHSSKPLSDSGSNSWGGSERDLNGDVGSPTQGHSVRFAMDEGSPGSSEMSPTRMDDMLPKSLEGNFVIVHGIAECDEEDDESLSQKVDTGAGFGPASMKGVDDGNEEDSLDDGSKAPGFTDETEAEAEGPEQEQDGDAATADVDATVATAESRPTSQQQSSRQSVSEFAEAFASMSITSVLNQFGDSLVMGGAAQEAPEDGGSTVLLPEGADAGQAPGSPHSAAGSDYVDDGDNASDIASSYYDLSVAGSVATMDAARHVEEWEVCRDFTSVALTEAEKREIDQLFKDTMYAFYKAKYRKASDVLECFLPILRKFPSSDPFHPDVARVQTAIKTIKARILFEQAQYADAKEVFDDALQHRIEVFGKAHYLCLELYLAIGEWHRSQAEYDAAEKYITQVRGRQLLTASYSLLLTCATFAVG